MCLFQNLWFCSLKFWGWGFLEGGWGWGGGGGGGATSRCGAFSPLNWTLGKLSCQNFALMLKYSGIYCIILLCKMSADNIWVDRFSLHWLFKIWSDPAEFPSSVHDLFSSRERETEKESGRALLRETVLIISQSNHDILKRPHELPTQVIDARWLRCL